MDILNGHPKNGIKGYWIFRPKIKNLGNCHLSVSFVFVMSML